LGGSLV